MKTNNPILRRAIYSAHKGRCFFTGRKLDFNDFHVDHLIPSAAGGIDEIENYVVCCPRINVLKSAAMDNDLLERMQYILKTVFTPRLVARIEKEKALQKGVKRLWAKPSEESARFRIKLAISNDGKYFYPKKQDVMNGLVKDRLPINPAVLGGLSSVQLRKWQNLA
jgi:hypothetical protein